MIRTPVSASRSCARSIQCARRSSISSRNSASTCVGVALELGVALAIDAARVDALVGQLALERLEVARLVDARDAVQLDRPRPVAAVDDRRDQLAGEVAAEDEQVGAVEGRGRDELAEADLRAVQVGGEVQRRLAVARSRCWSACAGASVRVHPLADVLPPLHALAHPRAHAPRHAPCAHRSIASPSAAAASATRSAERGISAPGCRRGPGRGWRSRRDGSPSRRPARRPRSRGRCAPGRRPARRHASPARRRRRSRRSR